MPQIYNFRDHIKGNTFPGVTFTILINGLPWDLTGAVISMQLRKITGSTNVFELSTTNGRIAITNPTEGIFAIIEQIIDIEAYNYYYDIIIILPSGIVKTYITGRWNILSD